MPSPVPTPVAAALGLVPTVLGGVRRLPGKAVQLPVYAVSHALTSIGTVRQGYDDLAERGERLIARLRGTSFDELEDSFEDRLKGTPLAKPYDRVEDALEDAGESVTRLVRKSTGKARSAAGTATRSVGEGLDKAADTAEGAADKAAAAPAAKAEKPKKAAKKAGAKASKAAEKAADATAKAADQVEAKAADVEGKAEATVEAPAVPDAEAPKGEPTPAATQPDHAKVDTAAAPDVVDTVEQVSEKVGGEVLAHDELPLPDYDHLTLGSLRGRMRSLDLPQLVQIRDYEKAHADRLPIVTMLDNRIAKLANDPTAPLSGGGQAPEEKASARGGSKVDPQTADPAASNPTVAFGGLGGAGKPS